MEAALEFSDLHHLAGLMQRREVSPVDLTEVYLDRIDRGDPVLNAYLAVTPDRARATARAAEAAWLGGQWLGPLHGMPVALKDLVDVAGLPTSAGSIVRRDRPAARDAWVARRLFQSGAVLLGKTHLVEFAYGGVGINHHYGTPWNPWDPLLHRIPGGSSSGSAVAVAAGLAAAALGSDTGGSVRIPAALCGLVGLKPTFGRVSNSGVVPLDPRLDSIGPMARTVRDAAVLYQVLAGPDPDDPETWGHACEDVVETLDAEVSGLRVCLPRQYFWEEVDPEVEAAVKASAQVFAGLGAQVEEIALEELDRLDELRQRGSTTAVHAYLYHREHLERDLDRLDPIVSARLLEGGRMSAVECLELDQAYARLRQRARRALAGVDALLTPTTRWAALPVAEVDRPERYPQVNAACLRHTVVANLWGLCAISLPCGATRSGLPIGLQLIGQPFGEGVLLRLAHAYQEATAWHRRYPRVESLFRGA